MDFLLRYLLLLVVFSLASCSLLSTDTSSDSEKKISATTESATQWLSASVESKWSSQLVYQNAASRVYQFLGSGLKEDRWGVLLDLDETVFDNTGFQKMLNERDLPFSQIRWRQWVESAKAGLIPGAAAFVHEVKRLGGLVIFVSNRHESSRSATRRNLQALGIPFDEIYLRQQDKNKYSRWQTAIREMDFTPVLWAGDQVGDFPVFLEWYKADGCPDFKQSYQYPVEEKDWHPEQLGRCIFLIANPIYGDWKRTP